eukprot:m.1249422 g.1249422  ORF g.1249422 m.1249422 type:complete len:690 (-) comp24701_c0_seq43:2236-4305(-)
MSHAVEKFISCIESVKGYDIPVRSLTACEIRQLEENGCTSDNWMAVQVIQSDTGEQQWALNSIPRIWRSHFSGCVILGEFNAKSTGILDSAIIESIVFDNVLISRCTRFERCIALPNVVVRDCITVVCSGKPTSFGNGIVVSIGPETGGRDVPITVECSLETISQCCLHTSPGMHYASIHAMDVEKFCRRVQCAYTVLDEKAQLLGCTRIEDAYIGHGAVIESSTIVQSTLLSMAAVEETTRVANSHVEDSLVHANCRIHTSAVVERSVMLPGSRVERHGMLLGSVLGTHSGVEEGEVSSSLVGPFVGFHHQALLVAAFWPEGRGNIGYGANVGSNHTGKLNDQEIWPGEGVFYGLGCNIKFPTNMTESPYTLIATGVTTLPQKVSMPFSLINSAGESIHGVAPGLNEIFPGWVLSDNMYTVVRNSLKYTRRQSSPTRVDCDALYPQYLTDVLRWDTIKMMVAARARLTRLFPDGDRSLVAGSTRLPPRMDSNGDRVYLDGDIGGGIGIGKNYLRESSRKRGIKAFTFYIKYWALQTLFRAASSPEFSLPQITTLLHDFLRCGGDVSSPPATASLTKVYSSSGMHEGATPCAPSLHYALHLIAAEGMCPSELSTSDAMLTLLARFADSTHVVAADIRTAKSKDYKRGVKVIPDYRNVHPPVEDDVVVRHAHDEAVRVTAAVASMRNARM